MSDALYSRLTWLPPPPPDFRARCRALAESGSGSGTDVAKLANFALDESQMRRLTSTIETMRTSGLNLAPFVRLRLGIVGNATLDPLVAALVASAARHGVLLECIKGDFGQTLQEALSPASIINSAKPDLVLLALDYRAFPLPLAGDLDSVGAKVEETIRSIDSMRHGFRRNCGAQCIVQTLAPPAETIFGSYDSLVPGTWRGTIIEINQRIRTEVMHSQDTLFDVAALAETVGLSNWHSPAQWNMAKFAFDSKFLPLYADHVARILGALRGKSRKCLILDLDNTLWGGVIGDDGMEGIRLGQGDATGEAFLDVQRTALALRARGIVLAVSSKNDDEIARAVFRDHTEMILREEHIAVFQANWSDKPTNIVAIARELGLGMDAMVFLDDNPVERAAIRDALPEVAVPELPNDPALYARTLAAAGYFEAVTFSEEDRERANFYEANARRVSLSQQVGDLESYLASLKMHIRFSPFDAPGRGRISQLINKTNQFNVTTRRYTEAQVAQMESDPDIFTLQVRLEDSFGDNGMISVLICRLRSSEEWEIDTWLMSCRVLGRHVEQMVLREVLEQARAAGIKRLIGTYIPTDRNGMVADLYEKFGFQLIEKSAQGWTTWALDTNVEIEPASMEVSRVGYEAFAV